MKTFTKAERLSGKSRIENLIKTGNSFNSSPFRIVWLEIVGNKGNPQIVISVPKRLFKRAVDRNKLKRQIREGYRKNKFILTNDQGNKCIHALLIYTSKTMIKSDEMENKTISMLHLLHKKIYT